MIDRPSAPTDRLPHAFLQTVGGEYFKTMEIPLLAGRVFNAGDVATAPRVVVIDEYLAKRQFPGADPIGRQINFGSPRNYTIVGVVGTVNGGDLARPVAEERIYFTVAQLAQSIMGIVVKTSVEPSSLAPQLRAAVQSVDAEQAIADVRTLDDWRSRSLQPRRTLAVLLTIFGGIALALSAIGIYGVLAFAVAERVREFGIRQALGADPASILALVLKQGLMTAGVGIVIGLAGSAAASRLMQTMLFGVGRHDPFVYVGLTSVLVVVAAAARHIPAQRATRVDPIVALRDA